MDTPALLIVTLLCLTAINGTGCDETQKNNNGYVYPVPMPIYNTSRTEYDRNQQDLLKRIVHLLEDISFYVRRHQQAPLPPQTIYIPYPVPYAVPQYVSTTPSSPSSPKVPNIDRTRSGIPDNPARIGTTQRDEVTLLDFNRFPAFETDLDWQWDGKEEELPVHRLAPDVKIDTIQFNSTVTEVPNLDDDRTIPKVTINTTATTD